MLLVFTSLRTRSIRKKETELVKKKGEKTKMWVKEEDSFFSHAPTEGWIKGDLCANDSRWR